MYVSLIAGLALALGAPAKKDAPKKEPPSIVGEWIGETGVRGGKADPPPPGTKIVFTKEGKVSFFEGKGQAEEGKYKIDAKKDPAELDLTPPEGKGKDITLLAIYKIEGDTLTIALAIGDQRPTKFESPAGSMVMLITCKRAK